MIKPQEKHEDVFVKLDYPDKVEEYYNILKRVGKYILMDYYWI